MVEFYIVVGSRGTVGKQVVNRLYSMGKAVMITLTSEILESSMDEVINGIKDKAEKMSINISISKVGVILAHRYRDEVNSVAVFNELSITRDFIWALSEACSSLRVVVLGSITGTFVDNKLPEAYHYAKDLQKSIIRQSIRVADLHMNLLALSWFKKYPLKNRTPEYQRTLGRLEEELGGDNLPSVESITDFCCTIIEMVYPLRGQSIVYDGGISLFQKD